MTDTLNTEQVDALMARIQNDLNVIKKTFLVPNYDDKSYGWIVEDHIYSIQDALNAYTNREFKATEPDPFG